MKNQLDINLPETIAQYERRMAAECAYREGYWCGFATATGLAIFLTTVFVMGSAIMGAAMYIVCKPLF